MISRLLLEFGSPTWVHIVLIMQDYSHQNCPVALYNFIFRALGLIVKGQSELKDHNKQFGPDQMSQTSGQVT